MWIPSSTPSPPNNGAPPPVSPPGRGPYRGPRRALRALSLAALLCGSALTPAGAQEIVFDPTNHVENALQAARALQSLTNEALMLVNQARELAASPYSHLLEVSGALKDMAALAGEVRGVAADIEALEDQFEDLYPSAVEGLDPRQALSQAAGRADAARETARDLARTAAELDRLSRGRSERLSGALSSSQGATGQTAAIQSSTQVLAVLAQDLGALQSIVTAQSRLAAEEAARGAAERAAGAEARRRFWGHEGEAPAPPAFDPFPNARR